MRAYYSALNLIKKYGIDRAIFKVNMMKDNATNEEEITHFKELQDELEEIAEDSKAKKRNNMNFIKLKRANVKEHLKTHTFINFDNVTHFYNPKELGYTLIQFVNTDTTQVEETPDEIMEKIKEE